MAFAKIRALYCIGSAMCGHFKEVRCNTPGTGLGVQRMVLSGTNVGGTATYICPIGWYDVSTGAQVLSMNCTSNGSWSGSPSQCARK